MNNTGSFSATPATAACHEARLLLATAGDDRRSELGRYIHRQFALHYDADVRHFMPWLTGIRLPEGWAAAAGFRLAGHEPLFLEHYLDGPIEQHQQAVTGLTITRRQIAEIGNLAGTVRPCVRALFVALTCLMQALEVRVVSCTANTAVRAVFREMGLPFLPVAEARRESLGEAGTEWGRYYDRRCLVMVADVQAVHERLQHSQPELLAGLQAQTRTLIEELPHGHAVAH